MMYIPDDATPDEVAELAAEAKAIRGADLCPCHGWLMCADRVSVLVDRSLSGFLTAAESAELGAEARRRGFR